MTHKKSRTKKKKVVSRKNKLPERTTVDMTKTPVSEFTYEQILEANNILNSSRTLWQVNDILSAMKRGYVLSKYEIQALNQLLEEFNTLYNSPLAQAMKEE